MTLLPPGSPALAVIVLFGLWPPYGGDLYMWLMMGGTWKQSRNHVAALPPRCVIPLDTLNALAC